MYKDEAAGNVETASLGSRTVKFFGDAILGLRWMLAPMYLLMYVGLGVYAIKFMEEVFELVLHFWGMTANVVMLKILELVDMGMVANLVVLVTTGGWSIFIREFPDILKHRPRWLNRDFSSADQKIKLMWSLIGVGSINLLNDLVKADATPWDLILKKIAIIATFVVVGYAFVMFNKLHGHAPSTKHEEPHQ